MLIGKNSCMYLVAVLVIAIPAVLHALWEGLYEHELLGPLLIVPTSTTLPYVCLALLFLLHCSVLESRSRRTAYCAVGLAWLSMVVYTTVVVFQSPMPTITSPVPLAWHTTSLNHFRFAALPYIVGTTVGWLWSIVKERKSRQSSFTPSNQGVE